MDSFIFNGNTDTPESVARRRQVADALAARIFGQAPQNLGSGIAAIGQALIARQMGQEADASEAAGRQGANAAFAPILGGGASPTPAAAPVADAGTSAPLSSAISAASSKYGVDPSYLTRVANVESGGDVNAANPNSSARGPFQFINSTAQQYGLTNPNDPVASADAAARLTLDNKNALTQALGREPTQGELYLAHQQGAGGAIKILQNPNAPVSSAVGDTAAALNGGAPGMTGGQFAQKWTSRFPGNAAAPAQVTQAGQDSAIPANAQPAQGFAIPGQPASPAQVPTTALISAASNPWLSKGQQSVVQALLEQRIKGDDQTAVVGNNLVNKKTGQVVYSADDKPKFQVIGEDQFGKKLYGYPPKPGEQPVAQQPTSAIPDNAIDLHGDDFLKTLDPTTSTQVRSIVEGRTPYPTGMLLKTPFGQKLAQYVTQADPTFEAGNAAARVKMQGDLSTGKLGQNNNALNTAIGHLGELSEAATKLNNWDNQYVNTVKNKFNTVTGSPEATNFSTIRDKVAEEFTKVYRGSGGSEADIKREIENLSTANSPAQLHGAIANMARLAQSKIDANESQYKNTMGPMVRYSPMVSDKTRQTLDTLEQREKGITATPVTKVLNGKTYVQHDGKWYEQ
jgi:hypothetical protein